MLKRVALLALVLAACMAGCRAEPRLLVYMLGCDLEADSGAASADLRELLRGTASAPVTVRAYLGGSARWDFPGLEDGRCYELEISGGEWRVLRDLGAVPSADGEGLCRFLRENADGKCDLVLWGHGLPGMAGIGADALFDGDGLSLSEIRAAIENSGVRIRLLGFDACEMANLQAAWLLAPCAGYFAASAQVEALSGWDYAYALGCLESEGDALARALRLGALQAARRAPEALPMTVLASDRLLDCAAALGTVLAGSGDAAGPYLSDAAGACADAAARSAVLALLDGQALLVRHWPATALPDESTLPGIGNSYRSFLQRR